MAAQLSRKAGSDASQLLAAGRTADAFRRAAADPRALMNLVGATEPGALDALDATLKATVLNFCARAFSRTDAFPRAVLAWLARDAAETHRALRGPVPRGHFCSTLDLPLDARRGIAG